MLSDGSAVADGLRTCTRNPPGDERRPPTFECFVRDSRHIRVLRSRAVFGCNRFTGNFSVLFLFFSPERAYFLCVMANRLLVFFTFLAVTHPSSSSKAANSAQLSDSQKDPVRMECNERCDFQVNIIFILREILITYVYCPILL